MDPNDPATAPVVMPDPTEPDFAMPAESEEVVAPLIHGIDQDDMFDPMAH